MEVYINGISAISPQNTYDNSMFLEDITEYTEEFLTIIKPDYKEFITPKLLRRMSKIIRMGVVSARKAMQEANIENPDAIIVGTGLGCMVDTEKFLNKMIENKETLLTPTSFIQSTHNTVGAQIAVMISCNNYNMTYVNQNISFETSLLDAVMMFEEGRANNILVGGIDEITEENYKLKSRVGAWKTEPISNLELHNSNTKGSLSGEGSTFALLSNNKTETSYAKFIDVLTIYKADEEKLKNKLSEFLENNNLNITDIDIVITGNNGDSEDGIFYNNFVGSNLPHSTQVVYKHLVGEYYSASAFAFWLASKILKTKSIPNSVNINNKKTDNFRNVLLFNYDSFYNNNYSFMLLSAL